MAAEKSIFEELAPYARMVVVPGVTVGNLTYSNQQDLYSVAAFQSDGGGNVLANTTVQFFNGAQGESAINQGFLSGTLSLNQTNSKFSKGQAPANQVYIATHAGFQVSQISSLDLAAGTPTEGLLKVGTLAAGSLNDVYSIAQNFSWDLTIGRGITRTIGNLAEYAMPQIFATTDEGPVAASLGAVAGPPTSAVANVAGQLGSPYCDLRKLEVPLIFPPLVNVNLTASTGSPFRLFTAATNNVQIKMILRGYLMTMPVG